MTNHTNVHSHVALRCVNVIKQGLYCHPFHRYTALESKLFDFTPKTVKHQKYFSLLCFYLASFNIRILFVHVSGEAKIRDLHFSSFSYEDVSCGEVPVDKLNPREMLI